jgi:hypothetical protein
MGWVDGDVGTGGWQGGDTEGRLVAEDGALRRGARGRARPCGAVVGARTGFGDATAGRRGWRRRCARVAASAGVTARACAGGRGHPRPARHTALPLPPPPQPQSPLYWPSAPFGGTPGMRSSQPGQWGGRGSSYRWSRAPADGAAAMHASAAARCPACPCSVPTRYVAAPPGRRLPMWKDSAWRVRTQVGDSEDVAAAGGTMELVCRMECFDCRYADSTGLQWSTGRSRPGSNFFLVHGWVNTIMFSYA